MCPKQLFDYIPNPLSFSFPQKYSDDGESKFIDLFTAGFDHAFPDP